MDLPSFPHVDLFSAGINGLYGVMVARSPSHDRGYTLMGLMVMAYFGGVGGGGARDVLLNELPGPFLQPPFLIVCLLMGLLGLAIDAYSVRKGEQFRTKILSVFKTFTLPWFAILGAHKALDHDLGIVAAIVVGLVATTAGGVFIDLFSGVTPEVMKPSEFVILTAVLASGIYTVLAKSGLAFFHITLIAVLAAIVFRMSAIHWHWHEIMPGAVVGPGRPGGRAPG